MNGLTRIIEDGNDEVHGKTILMGLMRRKLAALLRAGLRILEYFSRLLTFENFVGCNNDVPNLAVNEGSAN